MSYLSKIKLDFARVRWKSSSDTNMKAYATAHSYFDSSMEIVKYSGVGYCDATWLAEWSLVKLRLIWWNVSSFCTPKNTTIGSVWGSFTVYLDVAERTTSPAASYLNQATGKIPGYQVPLLVTGWKFRLNIIHRGIPKKSIDWTTTLNLRPMTRRK